jgi:hypothetical protein
MKCVTAQEASANHRVTAAIHLLKYADSCLNSELSRRTIAALPAEVLEAANDVPRHEFSMIAQIALRDSDGAVASARKLLSAIDREPRREWLHYSLNAVLALYYGGAVDEAVELAESRLHTAAAAEIPHLRMLFATFLWEYSRDMFDDERAKLYEAMIDQLACEFPSLGHQLPTRLARLSTALTDGDYPTARSITDRMIADGLLRGGIIRDRWRRIAELRLAQIREECEMTETALQSLMESAKQGLMTGGVCEAEAATVCLQLLRTGRTADASEFFRRFVSEYRTSRAPLARCMADVHRAIDARLA